MVDVAVIVPVLGRPSHAERLMSSFRANTPQDRAVVVPVFAHDDPVDDQTWKATWKAWGSSEAFDAVNPYTIICGTGHTFAAKVNAAYGFLTHYEGTEPSWFLLVGSDVIFHPGWLENALLTAELTGAKLIATNDLGNPRVMAGTHATHPLISRAYIDEEGASWDGPGVVCHEGYKHCFVDDELTTVAQQRGVFAFAKDSVVEHLHPYWGRAESDETYRLGESSFEADKALFIERALKNGCTLA